VNCVLILIAPHKPKLHTPSFIWLIIKRLILILAIYTLLNLTTIRFFIDGPSMQPTLNSGEVLMVNRLAYTFSLPERGHIVVFHSPLDPSFDYIKRVIGIPGDTIEIREQTIYVNGTRLREPYLLDKCSVTACFDGFWQLDMDEYFLMGDNRNLSYDSRAFGAVQFNQILGQAVLRYAPFDRLHWFSNGSIESHTPLN